MLRTAFVLATVLAANTASADLVSSSAIVKLTGFAHGSASVDVTGISGYVGAGEFTGKITRNGQTTSFLTYCTDIYQHFSWNTDYAYTQVPTSSGLATGFSARQGDLLGKLYTLAGAGVDTTDKSAAFQLAVWEIVTETGPALDLLSGSFYLEAGGSATQRKLASDWLAASSDPFAAKAFNADRLYSATTQDFVVFTPILRFAVQGGNQVPEPASLVLAALALAAMTGTRLGKR